MDDQIKKKAEASKLSRFGNIAEEAMAAPNVIFDILPGPDFMDKDSDGNVKDDMAADKPLEEKLGVVALDESAVIKHKSTFGLAESTVGGLPDAEDLEDVEEKKEGIPLIEKVIIPKYMFKGNGKFRKIWDFVIIFLAIYNSFTIPINIAFKPYILNTQTFRIIDSLVDLAFLVDIIITFRSTFLSTDDGVEITDPMRIASNYITKLVGGFFIDFISSVPLNDIVVPTLTDSQGVSIALEVVGLLKIIRISKLATFIQNLNINTSVKVLLKMLQMVLYLVLSMHLIACLWFFLVKQEEIYMLNLDFIWGANSIRF